MQEAVRKIREASGPLTYGETLGPAMSAQDEEEAREVWGALVEYEQRHHSGEDVEGRILRNIGYYAGYYGEEERARAYRFYGTSHPILPL